MVTVAEAQHAEHKARQLRIQQAAYHPPVQMDNIKPRGSEIDTIIKEICTYYRVRPEDILSDRRVKNNITPRHMMIYLLCKMTKYNTHHIARKIDRDPTTVLYAYKKIQQNLQSYQKDLDVLEPKLKQMLPPW